jgi:pimeloyl-ACP methyl ester carboxylesterase
MTDDLLVRERLALVGGRQVRSLRIDGTDRAAHPGPMRPLVVVLPGLGLPSYTLPTAKALGRRGLDCEVLDLPGFGSSRPCPTRPNIHAVGLAAAAWIRTHATNRTVVLIGHSTGAQAALTAAGALGGERDDLSLVLAGPTFAPAPRRLPRLLAATPFAYRDDRIRELHPSEIGRGRNGILEMLLSGLRDAPEERIAAVQFPVTVTSGVHDTYAPIDWLDTLTCSARAARVTRTALLGGSHNNLFTHPDEVADLLLLAATDLLG